MLAARQVITGRRGHPKPAFLRGHLQAHPDADAPRPGLGVGRMGVNRQSMHAARLLCLSAFTSRDVGFCHERFRFSSHLLRAGIGRSKGKRDRITWIRWVRSSQRPMHIAGTGQFTYIGRGSLPHRRDGRNPFPKPALGECARHDGFSGLLLHARASCVECISPMMRRFLFVL